MCSCFFFFKQKTAYDMRISDWSSDVCSSDLLARGARRGDVEPVETGTGPVDLDLAVAAGLQVHLAELVAITNAAGDHRDGQARRGLAVEQELKGRSLARDEVVRVGDRNQLDPLARRLEQGRRGFADGHENLVAIVRFEM